MSVFQTMRDFAPLEVVPTTEMDILRENIQYLHSPNFARNAVSGTFNVATTVWTKVSATIDTVIESTGGLWTVMVSIPLSAIASPTGQYFLDLFIDGVAAGDVTYGSRVLTFGEVGSYITFQHMLVLSSGAHTLSIYARNASGTPTVTYGVVNGFTVIQAKES